MALTTFIQSKFMQMNRQVDPTDLAAGQYALCVNGRIRDGGVQPIKLPKEILGGELSGIKNLQGIYGVDTFLVVFGDGKAFYRNYSLSNSAFFQIAGFQMSPSAPTIYMQIVPASTVNGSRIPTAATNNTDVQINGPIQFTSASFNGTPAAAVCQDGIIQPYIIFPDGTARITQNYSQWTVDNREYVPIGTLMIFINNKLYIVIKDANGRYTLIASSVSGRPLDFMVNIKLSGEKEDNEVDGDAVTTAYSVDYTPITCLSVVGGAPSSNGQGTSFICSTLRTTYLIAPNYNLTLFGEPTYTNQVLFITGTLNQFSIADLLGDTAIIDYAGIRSFNAIMSTKFEGRNAPFSRTIQKVFSNIVQNVTAAYTWDNYGWFAVQTVYGPAVMIYDTIMGGWIAVDIYPSIAPIKQFADIKTSASAITMFFITADNRIFQWGQSATVATCSFYAGEFAAAANIPQPMLIGVNLGTDIKPYTANVVFVNVNASGTVNLQTFMDSQKVLDLNETVEQVSQPAEVPISLPFGNTNQDQVRHATFDLTSVAPGWKLGLLVTWNFDAMLLQVSTVVEIKTPAAPLKAQARSFVEMQEMFNRQ